MKIVVIAWRHWAAGRRYRSLMLNAQRLGHSVTGFTSKHHSAQELTVATFAELGVTAYYQDEFHSRIDAINPDVIFGLWNSPIVQLEMWAAQWVADHDKVGFFINHRLFSHHVFAGFRPEFSRSHSLVSSQGQKDHGGKPKWPTDRIHVVGNPDLDFITEDINVEAVRKKLGCAPGQKLIGIFPLSNAEGTEELTNILTLAKQHNWRAVIHLHPGERRKQNEPHSDYGFYFQPARKGYWKQFQDMGAIFIASYCPGTVAGIEFRRCQSFELLRAADCLVSYSSDIPYEAYALGRNCFGCPFTLWTSKKCKDPSFRNLPLTEKIFWVLKHGNGIEQDPESIEKYFYKLDGRAWERMLNLAERLSK